MEYEIKALSAETAEDYLRFFDREEHSDGIDAHKCYCVCWAADDHREGLERMATAPKRRELAGRYVREGLIRGYLAYEGSRVVGWCNANAKSDCRRCIGWSMNLRGEDGGASGRKIKSVFCFAIAKDHRRKGIATRLLDRVCADAKREGCDAVEAYPKKVLKDIDAFEGPIEMYLRRGFAIGEDHGDYVTVVRRLRAERPEEGST